MLNWPSEVREATGNEVLDASLSARTVSFVSGGQRSASAPTARRHHCTALVSPSAPRDEQSDIVSAHDTPDDYSGTHRRRCLAGRTGRRHTIRRYQQGRFRLPQSEEIIVDEVADGVADPGGQCGVSLEQTALDLAPCGDIRRTPSAITGLSIAEDDHRWGVIGRALRGIEQGVGEDRREPVP